MTSMNVTATPTIVGAGEVTFVAANIGSITHELIVLPMLQDGSVGGLSVDAHHKVSESSSLGEASKPCASGAGDGVTPGKAGWVSMHLAAGRYELVCNEPGHYQSGMFTQLTVT
ncbi:MAG: sulfocyanin-like copper-binding protein [Candidatus Dormibacter sp.]